MKKFLISSAAILLAGVVLAATWGTGEGKTLAATTTPQQLVFTTTLNTVSVCNDDDADILFVLVNCDTNTLATRIAAGTAIPVPAGKSYTFDAQGNAVMINLCYATTNGAAVGYVAGY